MTESDDKEAISVQSLKSKPSIAAISNALAAAITSVLLQPLSALRTRMQSLNIYDHGMNIQRSKLITLLHTCKKEGPLRLYKGSLVSVALNTAGWFIFRFTYDTFKKCESLQLATPIKTQLLCGSLGSVCTTLCLHPLWNARLNLELQSKNTLTDGWPQYRGALHYLYYNLRYNGFGSLYISKETVLVSIPHYAMVITLYEHLSRIKVEPTSPVAPFKNFITGTISKLIPTFICYPFYVCRTMQLCHNTEMYKEPLHRVLWWTATNSPRGLYAGFHVQACKSLVNGGLLFSLYEHLHTAVASLALLYFKGSLVTGTNNNVNRK